MDELYGNAGIDTDLERETINYRPTLEKSKKERENNQTERNNDDSTMTEEEENKPVTDVYIDISETHDYVEDLVNKLEQDLSHTLLPISAKWLEKLRNAEVPVAGLDNLENGLAFEVYKESLAHPDHPTYALIQEAVEEYAEDIDGNVKLELYPDAVDVLENIKELHYLLSKSLYAQLLPGTPAPETPAFDEIFFKAIKDQEEKQYEALNALQNLHATNEGIYYEMLTTAFESDAYYEALEEFNFSKREHDGFIRRINQQKEMAGFGKGDSMMSDKVASRMDRIISADEALDEGAIESLVMKQYERPEEIARSLGLMQTAMKLRMNQQIEEKQAQKDLLKTTGGLSMKKRVHDEVINLTNARNAMFLGLYDMMNNMVEPDRASGVELFLDHIAEGMELVRSQYKNYLQEMYQIHMIDQEVRLDKVSLVQQKQVAREGYWLLDNLQK